MNTDAYNTIKKIKANLQIADYTIRQINKEIIIAPIEYITKPRKSMIERTWDSKADVAAIGISFLGFFIFPEFATRFKEGYTKRKKEPEETRQKILHDSSEILEVLDHSERIQYFLQAIELGIERTNQAWKQIKTDRLKTLVDIYRYKPITQIK